MLQNTIEAYLPADDLILGSGCFSVKVKIPQSGISGWIRNYLPQVYNHAREALSIKREDEGVCPDLNPYSTFS